MIDDPANGGSESGAWERAIRHTPALAAQVDEITRGVSPLACARVGVAVTPEPPAATPTPSTGART